MHHARQRIRTPVTIPPTYEGEAKERRGGWVVVGMVFICQHGLYRTALHRFCNKLGRVGPFNRAEALGPPRLSRGLPRHRTSVTIFSVSLDTEKGMLAFFAKRKYSGV